MQLFAYRPFLHDIEEFFEVLGREVLRYSKHFRTNLIRSTTSSFFASACARQSFILSMRTSAFWTKSSSSETGPSAAAFFTPSSFCISAGVRCGRSTLIVSLLSLVFVVYTGERVGTDIEALVPLQDHRQRSFHFLGGHVLAVDLKRAGAGTTNAREIVVHQSTRT